MGGMAGERVTDPLQIRYATARARSYDKVRQGRQGRRAGVLARADASAGRECVEIVDGIVWVPERCR